jgi:hypothetical protein
MSNGYQVVIPRWLRRLGCWELGKETRFRIGSWELSFRPGWGLQLGVGCGSTDSGFCSRASLMITPIWGAWFISLWRGSAWEHADMWESYGFSLDTDGGSAIHLNWGARCKIIHLPWEWHQVRHEVQRADGSWTAYRPDYGSWENDWQPVDDGRHKETHDYCYMLADGSVQEVKATIYVERRTLRWRGLRWAPFPRRVVYAIDVAFSGEVGERAGSWKGGCVGCGYVMRPGETGLDTLRRMQRERRFR